MRSSPSSILMNLNNLSVSEALGLGFLLTVVYYLMTSIYYTFFHPLKNVPGPWIARTSSIWCLWSMHSRTLSEDLKRLHTKYGNTVRIMPNEISFSTLSSLQLIYNSPAFPDETYFTKEGTAQNEMEKYTLGGTNIFTTHDRRLHKRLRTGLEPAFTRKALLEQEPLIQDCVQDMFPRIDAFLQQQGKAAGGPEISINIGDELSRMVWQLASEVALGRKLPDKARVTFDQYMTTSMSVVVAFGFLKQAFPFLGWVLPLFVQTLGWVLAKFPKVMAVAATTNAVITPDELKAAMESHGKKENERRNFLSAIADHARETGFLLADTELFNNAQVLFMASYVTTTATETMCFYYLLRDPAQGARLQHELRSIFSSADDMTGSRLETLPFLNAVLYEVLRLQPPINTKFAERTSPGILIDDVYCPRGTQVSADIYTIQRSPEYFSRPDDFCPERWFDNGPGTVFEGDNHAAWKPFLSGVRGCIGKSMALQSARVAVAHLFYRYDWELLSKDLVWERDIPSCATFEEFKKVFVAARSRIS